MTLISMSESENGHNSQALWNAFNNTVHIR